MTNIPTVGGLAVTASARIPGVSAEDLTNVVGQAFGFQVQGVPTTTSKAFQTFLTTTQQYGSLQTGMSTYVQAYEAPLLIAAAGNKAKSVDASKITDMISTFHSGSDTSGYVYQGALYTDPKSIFPKPSLSDFYFAPLAPVTNYLFPTPTS
jgi:hypothetical protein